MLVSEALIKECKRYNKIAQRELYNMYVPIFRAICRRYANCNDDAGDIMQEGFIKIFSKIKQYKGKGSFEGWMKRIMINTAISYYNTRKSKKELLFDDENKTINKPDKFDENVLNDKVEKEDLNNHTFGYDIVNDIDFSYDELFEMLDELPKPFKDVFNLHCIEGFKHKEIACFLKIDEKTSRTRLLRARNQLQKILYKKCVLKLEGSNEIQ